MKNFKLLLTVVLLVLVNLVAVNAQENAPIVSSVTDPISSENASKIEALVSLSGDVKDVSVSPDSSIIAVASQHEDNDYNISIFALDTGAEISRMQGRMDSFYDLVWSPDGKKIAVVSRRTTGGGAEEWSVKTYTIASGTNFSFYILGNSDVWYSDDVFPPDAPGNPVQVAWSPASNMIAIAFNERLDIYDVVTNTKLSSKPSSGVQLLQWTSDSKFIITRSSRDKSDQFGVT